MPDEVVGQKSMFGVKKICPGKEAKEEIGRTVNSQTSVPLTNQSFLSGTLDVGRQARFICNEVKKKYFVIIRMSVYMNMGIDTHLCTIANSPFSSILNIPSSSPVGSKCHEILYVSF